MRDPLISILAKGTNLDIQSFSPAIVYLNGEYWGIHNIRERIDKYYLSDNHGVDPDSIDLLEDSLKVVEGGISNYSELLEFLSNNDLSLEENYRALEKYIDLDNFLNYMTFQIYLANVDWPGNNLQYWRPNKPDGRWRWILYDTDYSLGFQDFCDYDHNTLKFATEHDGPTNPPLWDSNSPWSTQLLNSVLNNNEFKQVIINKFCDNLNSFLSPENVINVVDSLEQIYSPYMEEHISRWNMPSSFYEWQRNIDVIRTFAVNRPDTLRNHIKDFFSLEKTIDVNINFNFPERGKVICNSIELTAKKLPFNGKYFANIPIKIVAVPKSGYAFTGWTGIESASDTLILLSVTDQAIVANFDNITNLEEPLPEFEFQLAQNYPNPFNPETTINYSVGISTDVQIDVYDVLGRHIKKLVDEYKTPGNYTLQFGGNDLASGIYFYRLKTAEFISSKKMILVR